MEPAPPFTPRLVDGGGKPRERNSRAGYSPLEFIDPTSLQDQPIPERDWVVPGWIPLGEVTLLYGAGGEGKTLLVQQLMTACATKKRWLGMIVNPCRSMAIFTEDGPKEFHRRQNAINRMYGVDFQDLQGMPWSCPTGDDNTLMRFGPDGSPKFTERYDDLRERAEKMSPGLIVLDVAADLFGGNENDRQQVSAFMKAGLGRLAFDLNAAVILNAHPSRSGINSGQLDGGSTGWNGAARSRLGLHTPSSDSGEPQDMNARILSKKKANYGSRGDEIKLRWSDGVLSRDGQEMVGTVAGLDRVKVDAVFLDLLAKIGPAGLHASASLNAGNYAPRMFSKRPDRQGYTKSDFEYAMHRLFGVNAIRVEPYGKPSDDTKHIVPVLAGDGQSHAK